MRAKLKADLQASADDRARVRAETERVQERVRKLLTDKADQLRELPTRRELRRRPLAP